MSDTAALDPIELLPQGGLDPILTEARSLLAAIPAEASRYDALAAAARIYQDLGSRLSSMVYQHANSRSGHGLACAPGCSTCCHMPSDVGGGVSFQLSFLDYITLLESQAIISAAVDRVVEKAADSVEQARAGGTVSCPYLGQRGECGIYENRPVACKIWFSRNLAPCEQNRGNGYRDGETNLDTAASRKLLEQYNVPFVDFLAEHVPKIKFYPRLDFLRAFAYAAHLEQSGLSATQKRKIDEDDLEWSPFPEYEAP